MTETPSRADLGWHHAWQKVLPSPPHLFKASSCPPLTSLLNNPPSEKRQQNSYLKHSEERLREVIKRAPPGLHLIEVELPSKQLHPQEGEDDDEEEEEQQQGGDGAH